MNLIANLAQLDFMVTVAVNITVAYLVFPAYKRTHHKGFLFWGLGALLSLWNTVSYHTFGMTQSGYEFTRYSYRILFVVDAILGVIGTVMVIKSYLRLFDATQATPDLETNTGDPGSVVHP